MLVSPATPLSAPAGRSSAPSCCRSRAFPTRWRICCDRELAEFYRDGCYVTLRLTAAMYHRFHAPHDCRVEKVTHIWGDTWNVNPIALKRVKKLFCKNERAVIRTRLQASGHLVTLVPVAAILVAGIRLRFLDIIVDPRHRGPNAFPAMRRSARARRWAGSSTARPSSCLRRKASRLWERDGRNHHPHGRAADAAALVFATATY